MDQQDRERFAKVGFDATEQYLAQHHGHTARTFEEFTKGEDDCKESLCVFAEAVAQEVATNMRKWYDRNKSRRQIAAVLNRLQRYDHYEGGMTKDPTGEYMEFETLVQAFGLGINYDSSKGQLYAAIPPESKSDAEVPRND